VVTIASVVLVDVEDPVATAETVRADTDDVKWAMPRRVVHLGSLLPVSVAGLAEVVALLLLRGASTNITGGLC
jgi:hypothetical protein